MRKTLVFLSLIISVTYVKATDLDTRIQSAYIEARQLNERAKAAVTDDNNQQLRVLTVNLGLLNGSVAYVPEYEARRKEFTRILGDFIFANHAEIIFVQEIWYEEDFHELNAMARKEGLDYAFLDESWKDSVSKSGLQILVRKKSLLPGSRIDKIINAPFSQKTYLDYWGGIRRSFVVVPIVLANGRKVFLANAHLSPTAGANDVRKSQVHDMVELLRQFMKEQKEVVPVILGADFNISPEVELSLPNEEKVWLENREPYVDFYESIHLLDTFKAVNQNDKGYTWDKRNNTLVAGGPKAIKDEPLQRVSFIWAGMPANKMADVEPILRVDESRLVFTEPEIESQGKKVHLTDHFGVFSKMRIKN